MADN